MESKEMIGLKIKLARQIAHMTQQQLGEKIGKTRRTIHNYENGSVDIPIPVLITISQILGDPDLANLADLTDGSIKQQADQDKLDAFTGFLSSIGADITSNQDGEYIVRYDFDRDFTRKVPLTSAELKTLYARIRGIVQNEIRYLKPEETELYSFFNEKERIK